jgi:hypothetical protein
VAGQRKGCPYRRRLHRTWNRCRDHGRSLRDPVAGQFAHVPGLQPERCSGYGCGAMMAATVDRRIDLAASTCPRHPVRSARYPQKFRCCREGSSPLLRQRCTLYVLFSTSCDHGQVESLRKSPPDEALGTYAVIWNTSPSSWNDIDVLTEGSATSQSPWVDPVFTPPISSLGIFPRRQRGPSEPARRHEQVTHWVVAILVLIPGILPILDV